MVGVITNKDREQIDQALRAVATKTRARFAVALLAESDPYHAFLMLFGLTLGSAVALGVWWAGWSKDFPTLLALQLAAMLFMSVPGVRRLSLRLVPLRVRREQAARQAGLEYLAFSRHGEAKNFAPTVVLHVAFAERYAHIFHSRSLHEKIPHDAWEKIVRRLTTDIPKCGARTACLQAVEAIGALLAEAYPVRPGA